MTALAGPLVYSLVMSRGPSAVPRSIGTIVIDALQRQPLRTRPHVANEAGEVASPFIAHDNAAPAVVRIRTVRRHVAALLGRHPYVVLGSARQAMYGARGRYATPLATTTTDWSRPSQHRGLDKCGSAAIAEAFPQALFADAPRLLNNCQSSDAHAFEPTNDRHLAILPFQRTLQRIERSVERLEQRVQ